ncbi:Mitochondrial substrate carrier family protein [Perilla frutescens var. frutescens]|nr:Mitochondrial substrate carrier family protein [Perilla frutescens var. frutescens]
MPVSSCLAIFCSGIKGENCKMGDVAKDLTAGTVGGAANLIVGHPFDTIKVKLQSQPAPLPGQLPKYTGAMDAVKQTLAAEGPRGLYKGMGAPFATVAAFNALLFTVRGQMEALLRSEPGAPLTVNQQVVCGAGAGVAVSFLACPTELIKCRLQAQSAVASCGSGAIALKYGGPMDVARQVLQSEGGARGLFKGLFPTMAREVPGNAAMFGVYEALKQSLAGGQDTSSLGRGSLMLAGGLAGATFWLTVYPTDVIKSVIQVDDYKNPKFSGSIDAFKKIVKSEGVKGLYKGFGPAMARSIPANGACFLAYEVTRGFSLSNLTARQLASMATEELNKSPSLPPYPQMIMEALDAMKQAEGANKSSILKYTESKYGEMPPGHAELLSYHLTRMKDSGELLFIKNNYLKPGPEAPLKRGRGRPPKPKEPLPPGTILAPPRPRGRPRKDPNAPPAPKKPKPPSAPPSISKTGRPRGRPRKVNPQPLQNGVEA